MVSVSGISTTSKIFSKLGNNSGSVVPMFAKDFSSAALTSATYYKEGGEHDGAEKALEEFGTSILWLGGIPFIKKFVFDKFIYKKAGINPDVDAKRLFAKGGKSAVDSLEFAKERAQSIGYTEQTEILQNTINNKNLAKKLSVAKFGVATALTGLALFGLINFKQKRTENKIKEEVKEKRMEEMCMKNALEKNSLYNEFNQINANKNNEPSFKGMASNIGTFFMSNPVANTALVDAVITGTRLKEARKGEKFEVGLRELCELAFIYGLAVPLQKGMEFASEKIFKRPISLDWAVLDSKEVKSALNNDSQGLLEQAKHITGLLAGGVDKSQANENSKKAIDYILNNQNSELVEIFKKNGDIATFTTKEGKSQLSMLSSIDTDKLKKTAQKTIDFIENGAKNSNPSKYLKQAKFLKGASIIGNIAISAVMLGVLQPKLNLYLRKKLNNGDNTNPAIRDLENEIKQNFAFEGDSAKDKKV